MRELLCKKAENLKHDFNHGLIIELLLASNKAVFTSNFGNNFLSENIFKQLSVQLFDKICGPMQNFIQRSLSSLLMGTR